MNMLNQIDFRALRLFVAVFDLQSFSLVARREDVSASLVTRTINQLESSLGQQLFHRNTRAVAPTEAGSIFAAHARTLLAQLADAQAELQEKESEPSGLVRINAPVVFGQRHIAPWLAELYQRYPRIRVDLTQTDSYIDPHREGADLIFRIGVLADSGLQARIFGPQINSLLASPAYVARYGRPETPEDLAAHRSLAFNGPQGLNRWYFRRGQESWRHYPLNPVLTSNNADTLLTAALNGMGMVLFPDWMSGEHLSSGRLINLLEGFECATTLEQPQIAAVWPKSRRLPLKVRATVDFFVGKFGSPLNWRNR
ncbi:LysR family transcriptional regulator [Erwinia sp. E602]|uniref:LysR family transcriptional regulator n=1 Tax=Erwinia sp. E602 TaxID=2675378 RepID=UPI001BA5788C|nr:LysR family transcriptional regulator [Erwinia sp. E602]QUG77974.1 LysR family transcriptional regulator [Erwinia sp. E602]